MREKETYRAARRLAARLLVKRGEAPSLLTVFAPLRMAGDRTGPLAPAKRTKRGPIWANTKAAQTVEQAIKAKREAGGRY